MPFISRGGSNTIIFALSSGLIKTNSVSPVWANF